VNILSLSVCPSVSVHLSVHPLLLIQSYEVNAIAFLSVCESISFLLEGLQNDFIITVTSFNLSFHMRSVS
jgi:hypothetical protein